MRYSVVITYVAWIYIFVTQFPFEEVNHMNPSGDLWKMFFFYKLENKNRNDVLAFLVSCSSFSRLSWGTVKRATKTCNLLCNIPAQNQLNSYDACFTTHESNLSFNKSGCCRFQIVVSERRGYSYTFYYKICVLRGLPAQNKLDVIPVYGATPA